MNPCPSCGFLVFAEPAGSYDICPVCGWEDDAVQLRFPGMNGGANGESLKTCQDRILRNLPPSISAQAGFSRDARWRPLRDDEFLVPKESKGSGVEYFHAACEEAPGYYWLLTEDQTQSAPHSTPTLLLSARPTEDSQALWRAAIRPGWNVERVRGIRIPAGLVGNNFVLYAEGLFAPAIAEQLSLKLIEPIEDWLVRLPLEYRKRQLRLATLGEARRLEGPAFIKPPNEKSFKSMVYATGAELPTEFDDSMAVLIAEPVSWEAEYRCFVLDRAVKTLSPYLRSGRLAKLDEFAAPDEEIEEARGFAEHVLADAALEFPHAVVLDIGRIAGDGWAVVELNGAWGSGIYGCDPNEVLAVIRHATIRKTAHD